MFSNRLDSPAVWKGDELVSRKGWGQPFSETSKEWIQEELETGAGAVFLKGFPIDKYDKDSARAAFEDWSSRIGSPLSQNEKGQTVFDVSDAGFGQNDPRTRGPNTNKKLSFHTDRSDVISFLCWKQAKTGGENQIVSSMHLFNEIARRRPDLLEVLMEPFTYKRHTVDLGNEQAWCEQPIFSFRDDHFACSFLRVLINRAHNDPALPDLSPAQIEAMDLLEAIAEEPGNACHFLQETGDILLVNNWTLLHRRSAFEDHEALEDRRCLFRIWLSMPNSRPLDSRFASNFGATEAGAIRGGFRSHSNRT